MESVQLRLNCSQCPNIKEIEWSFCSNNDKQQILVSWKPSVPNSDWYLLEENYRLKLSITEMGFLNINNLTVEMSGLYTANIKFYSGQYQKKDFKLCVYESIPLPQILIHAKSYTSGWCNVSLECGTLETTEHLTVTWDLPREVEQRQMWEQALNKRNISLTLPLNQIRGSLTCMVNNPVDQKNATLFLKDICLSPGSLESQWILCGIFSVVLMAILGAGGWFYEKKMNAKRGVSTHQPGESDSTAIPQTLPTEEYSDLCTGCSESHNPTYSDISFLNHPQTVTEKDSCYLESSGHSLASITVYDSVKSRALSSNIWTSPENEQYL